MAQKDDQTDGQTDDQTDALSADRSVKVVALLKAQPGMSREEFKRRWVEQHAPMALRMERLRGYRINVAIEQQEIEGELPYDGTAELWWDSLEDMQADFDSEVGLTAGDDADSFTVVRQHIYTEEHVLR